MQWNFTKDVITLLYASGWWPGRAIDPEPLMDAEFQENSRVREILSSLGGLTIRGRDGSEVLEFIPERIERYNKWTRRLFRIIEAPFFPLASYGQGCVIIDELDRVFVDIGCSVFFVADTFERSLEVLLVHPQRMSVWWPSE